MTCDVISNSLLKNKILLFIPFFTVIVTTLVTVTTLITVTTLVTVITLVTDITLVPFTTLITVTTLVSLSEVTRGFFRDEKVYNKECSGCHVISETSKDVHCSAPSTEAVCLFISSPTKVT